MREEVATEVLEVYSRKKIDLPAARVIVETWAQASGWEQDRWGNYHPAEGRRVKLTKRVVQRQAKRQGAWRNLSSTPLVQAAQNLVEKAAEALGQQDILAKVRGAQKKRVEVRQRQHKRAEEQREQQSVEQMALKIVSAEQPEQFAVAFDTKEWLPDLRSRYNELVRQLPQLRAMGRMPADGELFSVENPPLAPLLTDVEAEWVESIRGVSYTITVRHAGANQAIIEIGTTAGEMSIGTRVDPVTMGVSSRMDVGREGDAYLSGRIQRTKKGPYGALFMLISQVKQRGAGSRVLDLWCDLMEAYGAPAWVAEGVGEEGMAFLEAKIRVGRLEELGRQGANMVVRCLGGPEGRQQALAFNPADVLQFPERPDRIDVGSRSYALSDMGPPVVGAALLPESDVEDMEERGARVIDGGGTAWRYVWLYEPRGGRLEMWRHSDGDWKFGGSPMDVPQTFEQLRERGQLNTVGAAELDEFDAAMRERSEGTLVALKESWESIKSDEQQRVEQLVEQFYREHVEPEVERAWTGIERGVFPFDFEFNERLAQHKSREDQARMHALHAAMKRTGFTSAQDSPLERFVLQGLGFRSWEQLEDQQSIEWAYSDVLDDVVYPTV